MPCVCSPFRESLSAREVFTNPALSSLFPAASIAAPHCFSLVLSFLVKKSETRKMQAEGEDFSMVDTFAVAERTPPLFRLKLSQTCFLSTKLCKVFHFRPPCEQGGNGQTSFANFVQSKSTEVTTVINYEESGKIRVFHRFHTPYYYYYKYYITYIYNEKFSKITR